MASLSAINEGKMTVYQTLAIAVCGVLGLERADELDALQQDLNQKLEANYATKS